MSHSLAIGRLPEPLLPAVTLWLQQALSIPSIRARSIGQSWADYSEQVDIDALNLASVELFLDHAASLEGLRNSAEAIEAGKWRNLPYWIESVWVPLGSSGAEPQVLNADYAPIFVGSIAGLVENLRTIASLSRYELGTKPEQFDFMINHPREWAHMEVPPLDHKATIQWVWFTFMEGARVAQQVQQPLFSG